MTNKQLNFLKFMAIKNDKTIELYKTIRAKMDAPEESFSSIEIETIVAELKEVRGEFVRWEESRMEEYETKFRNIFGSPLKKQDAPPVPHRVEPPVETISTKTGKPVIAFDTEMEGRPPCHFCKSMETTVKEYNHLERNCAFVYCLACGAGGPLAGSPLEAVRKWGIPFYEKLRGKS